GVIEKSIAVLPFENISANKDDAYFADGVQDEILNNLAKIAQLKVISRTSVMQYRADNKRDLRQIAGALGVANVLEGTVRRDGNHMRISTELIDARDDNTIWADSYDRDLTNIFSIQSEIAQTVASKLSAKLSPPRRSLGDAAVNECLRLRPDLPVVHLAAGFHLYTCYRDFERARVQIAIAAQVLSNNPDLLELTALIDRVQGRWEKSTSGLDR